MTQILTLRMDPNLQAHFDLLRQRHFPPERNHIAAHLTLFHTLPDDPSIAAELAAIAPQFSMFPLRVTGLRSLGKGVAYKIASPELLALHTRLVASFSGHLTPQDKQRFQPHIVVQNKVTPGAARALLADLERTFAPVSGHAAGLDLWHYLGGPWSHAETFPFARPIEEHSSR